MVTVTAYTKFIKKLWQDSSNAIYIMRIASWLEMLYIHEWLYTTKTVQEEKSLPVVWSESLVDIPEEEKVKKK